VLLIEPLLYRLLLVRSKGTSAGIRRPVVPLVSPVEYVPPPTVAALSNPAASRLSVLII